MNESAFADEYFNRSALIVAGTPYFDMPVRYCVFARRSGLVCGADRAVAFIRERCTGPVRIAARHDGERFGACEVVLIVEGRFGELVNLETTYLGMLALSGAARNMAAIVEAAGEVPVVDMSARHYPHEIIEQVAYAAAVGGAQGTSTPAGCAYVHKRLGVGDDLIKLRHGVPKPFRLYGSVPHALNGLYGGSSVLSAGAYHERLPDVPLTVLIDYEGRELDVCRQAYERFGRNLFAVRLDTGGSRVHQGGHEAPLAEVVDNILSRVADKEAARRALDRYGFGKGVTLEAVYNVRRALDAVGATDTRIVVSSGFTLEKVEAFAACKAPMDAVGTGSWVEFQVFTSDITAVQEDGTWRRRCKAGRAEELSVPGDLPLRVERT